MKENSPKTPVGEWMSGVLKLYKSGFSREQIFAINGETSELVESILQYYCSEKESDRLMVKTCIGEWFDNIVELKKAGMEFDEILNILTNIKESYYYTEYDDDYFDDDGFYNEFSRGGEVDDDDEDDDDDDDNDDFDPKKFFPRK